MQEEKDLAERVAAFEQEMELMAAVGIADHDVLTLNVGGTVFCTKRSTLTQLSISTSKQKQHVAHIQWYCLMVPFFRLRNIFCVVSMYWFRKIF